MAIRKSTRVKSGNGGRPTGNGVRHSTSHKQQPTDIDYVTPDEEIEENLEIEDDIRKSIRQAVVKNLKNIPDWIESVGETDPKGALTIMKDYIEFVLPKLMRTDSKIDTENPIQLKFESIEDYTARKAKEESKIAKEPKIIANDFPTIKSNN